MDRYRIYCTSEQTRKALELGAPIYTTNEHLYNHPHEYKYWAEVDIQGNFYAAKIPTAEQLIGWLEGQDEIKSIVINVTDEWEFEIWGFDGKIIWYKTGFDSRKESTIAAIDAALEYLKK